jgi:hypothetical protein
MTTAVMQKPMNLRMADSPTRHSFLITFQELCNRYNQLAVTPLHDSFKQTVLQASIVNNTALLNSWNSINEVRRAQNPGMPVTVTYSEYFSFLINQSKTHDLATSLKRVTHHAHQARQAHQADFDHGDTDKEDNDDNDDDSVLDEVLAHMSLQNEPLSEETVNALQVFSTFQRKHILHVHEIRKLRYHLHFIVRYLENYVLHGHVKIPKSKSVSCYANIKQLPSKELRRIQ